MRRCFTLTPLFAIFLLAAGTLMGCGPGEPMRDAGGRLDAGSDGATDAGPLDDAGPPDDGGVPTEDASLADAGPDAGACSVDCSTIEAPPCMMSVCNDGSLPGTVGECVMVPMPDDTACDDGDFCTLGETCTAGACGGGAPNDCGMVAAACREIVCDSAAETCTSRAATAMNGMPCTYPDLCVSGTTCSDGLCTNGTRMDCSSLPVPNECQVAFCNSATGGCELMNTNEGGSCIDPADPCTSDHTCTAGACGGGSTPTDCSSLDSQCAVGVCDPSDGSCAAMPINEGMPCDDGVLCTSDTVCTAGACAGGTAPACSMTPDACCPPACTASDDADCGCPGEIVGSTCVYLPTTVSVSDQPTARAACTALGTGWDLCSAAMLCMPPTLAYLAASGCNCTGGAATCACGSASNVYVHVDGSSPHYVRGPAFAGCFTSMSCTHSVSETCGVALCCR